MSDSTLKIKQSDSKVLKSLEKIDENKITYNVDADIKLQTSNALDILRKIPLITVDGFDNIMLKGASNFKILVNGKESLLMSYNLKNVLLGMPANLIKAVEVFTNPPTKYSAEGIGGIINIVTTHSTTEGELGSISLRADLNGGLGGSFYTAGK
jgi:Outer membrane cobalamin receptor protein